MNESINQSISQWMNEWINERINELMNNRMKQWMSEFMEECYNEWILQQTNEIWLTKRKEMSYGHVISFYYTSARRADMITPRWHNYKKRHQMLKSDKRWKHHFQCVIQVRPSIMSFQISDPTNGARTKKEHTRTHVLLENIRLFET